jgi:WD40 repeat protein
LAVSGSLEYIASAALDQSLQIFHLSSKQNIATFLQAHENKISCIEFFSNGKFLATASFDSSIKIYNYLTSKELLHLIDIHDSKYQFCSV